MNPQLVESILDRVESLGRMAAVFQRDAAELCKELKIHLYQLTSTEPDSVAFVAGVDAALDRYMNPAHFPEGTDTNDRLVVAEVKAGLRQTLLDNYQLNKTNDAMGLSDQVRSVESIQLLAPEPAAAGAAAIAEVEEFKENLIEQLLTVHVQAHSETLDRINNQVLRLAAADDLRDSYREVLDGLTAAEFDKEVRQKLGAQDLEKKMQLLLDVANMIGDVKRAAVGSPLGELLREHLSPELFAGGKGLVLPSRTPSICKYKTPVTLDNVVSLGWPTGWYGVGHTNGQLLIELSPVRSVLLNWAEPTAPDVYWIVSKNVAVSYRDLGPVERDEVVNHLTYFFTNLELKFK